MPCVQPLPIGVCGQRMSGEARHLCRHNAANPEDRHTSLCFRRGNKRLKGKNIQITGHSSLLISYYPCQQNGVAVVKSLIEATVPRNTGRAGKSCGHASAYRHGRWLCPVFSRCP